MSQPVAADDLVMSAYPADGGHQFGAFRISDGEPVWNIPIPADVIQAPQVRDGNVYFATMDGTAHKVRVRDGHEYWSEDVGAASAIWVDGDHALLSRRVDRGGHPQEQPIVLSTSTGAIARRGEMVPAPYLAGGSRDRELLQGQMGAWGGVPSGEHLGLTNVAAGWGYQGNTPAVADGRAYFAVAGEIHARDIATAEDVWSRRYAEAAGAQAISPPAVVGSQLFFGTIDGHVYAADIDTGMILWAYDVGEPVVFQPIVAEGWIYVATGNGNLVGLEIGDPRMDGWHMWGGNERHAGLVETAGEVDPHLLASLERPSQGAMHVARFEQTEEEEASDATAAAAAAAEEEDDEDGSGSAATVVEEERMPDLPLVRTRVHADVSGFVARVTVTQEFTNPHDKPIEAIYMFPLPADSAVDDMEMHVGERVIRGRIQRRAQARQTYEEARSEGRHAALLEQQRPNLFAQSVANIAPGERIEVSLEYVQILPFENGAYELVYPMVAPPRYDPSDPSAVLGDPAEVRQANEVALEVEVNAGMPVASVDSPSHALDVDRHDRASFGVTLAESEEIPNRDFVLRYAIEGDLPRATVLAHRGDEGPGHFSLVVQPPAAPAADSIGAREITFVVDTSSSMQGAPMEHAKAIVRHALGTLRSGDTFNVLAFSDRIQHVASRPVEGTEANLARAETLLDGLRGTGATEMVPAIDDALTHAGRAHGDRLPIVVLLTDGYIGNEADVLRAIATDLGDARVYTVGVGSATNRFLLERAAEIGRGRSMVVTLSENASEAGDRFSSFVDAPLFTDVEIDWGGLDVEDVYPRRLPDLFAGKPLVVHGRYAHGGTAEVKVRGTIERPPLRARDQRRLARAQRATTRTPRTRRCGRARRCTTG